jgi:hypothetical protein
MNAFLESHHAQKNDHYPGEEVYDGLYKTVGKRKISQFIEDLIRPLVLDTSLDSGYAAMATDTEREAESMEWSNAILVRH